MGAASVDLTGDTLRDWRVYLRGEVSNARLKGDRCMKH